MQDLFVCSRRTTTSHEVTDIRMKMFGFLGRRYWRSRTVRPNKSLHWPPGGPCHASCTVMIDASHEVRQILAPVS